MEKGFTITYEYGDNLYVNLDRFPSAPLDFLYSTWIAFPMGGFIP